MALFGKRETVFSEKNQARYELCKRALQDADIRLMESGSYETEAPISGCGAKLDIRDFGPNGKIDRRTYYLAVHPEDAARARAILETI